MLFIDDLDRCMPRIAFNILEQLKIWLDIEGYTTILALSKEEIILVVKKYLMDELGIDEPNAKKLAKDYTLKILPLEVYIDESDLLETIFKDNVIIYKAICENKSKDLSIKDLLEYDLFSDDDNFQNLLKKASYRKLQHFQNILILEKRINEIK